MCSKGDAGDGSELSTYISVTSRTHEVYLHAYVFCLLLGDQSQDGAAVFTGSDQDLKPGSPRWQRGRQLVMYMAVAVKGILRDFWCRGRQAGRQTDGERWRERWRREDRQNGRKGKGKDM